MNIRDLQARAGQILATSGWITIDQPRINAFAAATGDMSAIHVDVGRARDGPFGTTIAHGALTLSLLAAMAADGVPAPKARLTVNYGYDRVRFVTPVRCNARIRGHFGLMALSERACGQWRQLLEVSVEIEGEARPALVAEWVLLHTL